MIEIRREMLQIRVIADGSHIQRKKLMGTEKRFLIVGGIACLR